MWKNLGLGQFSTGGWGGDLFVSLTTLRCHAIELTLGLLSNIQVRNSTWSLLLEFQRGSRGNTYFQMLFQVPFIMLPSLRHLTTSERLRTHLSLVVYPLHLSGTPVQPRSAFCLLFACCCFVGNWDILLPNPYYMFCYFKSTNLFSFHKNSQKLKYCFWNCVSRIGNQCYILSNLSLV